MPAAGAKLHVVPQNAVLFSFIPCALRCRSPFVMTVPFAVSPFRFSHELSSVLELASSSCAVVRRPVAVHFRAAAWPRGLILFRSYLQRAVMKSGVCARAHEAQLHDCNAPLEVEQHIHTRSAVFCSNKSNCHEPASCERGPPSCAREIRRQIIVHVRLRARHGCPSPSSSLPRCRAVVCYSACNPLLSASATAAALRS